MPEYDLVYKRKDSLGLDIGATYIKIVQLKKKKNLTKLVGYVSRKIPENYVIEGIVSEPEKVAQIVKEMLSSDKEIKYTAKKVVASLPDSKVFTRVLELPEMSEKELKEAVSWEADQSIPMAITDLILDWQILGPSLTKDGANDVLLVAAPVSIVNSYVQLFNLLGLQPEAIEMSLASVMRALVSNKEKEEVMVVVDMGGKSTNLGIYDNTLRFTDSMEIGGETLTGAIVAGLGLTPEKAEKLKIEEGLNSQKAAKYLIPVLDGLKTEIKKVMRYYSDRSPEERKPSKIILTGGSSMLEGLPEFLSEGLDVEIKVGNPWVNIDTYPLKAVPKAEAPTYTNAIGLCLRAIEEGI